MFETFPNLLAQTLPVLDRMMPGDIIPVIAITLGIGGGVLVALTAIIVGNWRKVRDRKLVATLIQDMLDRNMTAGEIQQVLSTWQAVSESEVRLPNLRTLAPQSQSHLPPKPAKLA